jgi:hypothetical protein
MKSVQISEYGSGGVIKINEISPIPSPSTGKILAEVIAAGVNPADWKVREGYFREMKPLQFPSTFLLQVRHFLLLLAVGACTLDKLSEPAKSGLPPLETIALTIFSRCAAATSAAAAPVLAPK